MFKHKKAFLKAFIICLVFAIGFLASNIYAQMSEKPIIEKPADDKTTDVVPSPNDWIKESQIKVYNSQVILDLQEAEWATFTDTHSMEPVLSSRSNAIEIIPKNSEQIKVGDIVS
jgi:hypothetical protein